ncbi:glutamate racemase [bacterium]|nr:glutamate racemase [bacterium]MDB4800461.1 glutamate racemase [bacterium]MDB4817191.1 glutamate racemase [bacterium]MDC1206069.1 glutamate racemase [Akkermansiaceae bacterium]
MGKGRGMREAKFFLQTSPLKLQSLIVIGVLDSGVGGLSVLREIHALIPRQSIHYIGDSAWCPYGTKPFEKIRARVFTLSDHLIAEGAEAIVIACNSATIAAVEALRERYDIPFIGMEPGVKPAVEQTRSRVIGVLATEASLSGEKFRRLVSEHAQDVQVITRPCPKFVTLVEAGILKGPEVSEAVEEYTADIIEAGADVLILGCTHYPFLKEAIIETIPAGIRLIDTGAAVARRVAGHELRDDAIPEIRLHSTGPLSELDRLVPILCSDLKASCHPFSLS